MLAKVDQRITLVTFSAARGASIQLFTTVFLHIAVAVVLQAPVVSLFVFFFRNGLSAEGYKMLNMTAAFLICPVR